MNKVQQYEAAIMREHNRFQDMPGFNPEYRKGLKEAHSIAHNEWCENNPGVTREERKKAYRESYDKLRPLYPSVKELQE